MTSHVLHVNNGCRLFHGIISCYKCIFKPSITVNFHWYVDANFFISFFSLCGFTAVWTRGLSSLKMRYYYYSPCFILFVLFLSVQGEHRIVTQPALKWPNWICIVIYTQKLCLPPAVLRATRTGVLWHENNKKVTKCVTLLPVDIGWVVFILFF